MSTLSQTSPVTTAGHPPVSRSVYVARYSLEAQTRWADAATTSIDQFLDTAPQGRPRTEVRMAFDDESIHVRFDVFGERVRSVHTDYGSAVCEDSCVELFIAPPDANGYFNFEVNAGGTLHAGYVHRPSHGGSEFHVIPEPTAGQIVARTSLPQTVEPATSEPLDWWAELSIPVKLMETYVGTAVSPVGGVWHGNFYKCGLIVPHPHWASWNRLAKLDFHQPSAFGLFHFVRDALNT